LRIIYNGAFFQNIVPQWANNNVNLIKTIPKNTLNQMQNIIEEGFNSGTNLTKLSEKITQAYGINKRHALFIARDQIAKLNAQITQQQQSDAGVQEYIWDTSEDRRVRPYHAKLNGTRQKWSEPPIVDKNDRRCHPGEDYQCRCAALPVFDIDTLNVPWIPENSNIFGSLLTTGLINDTMNIDKANDFNQLSKALQDQYGVNINSDVEDLDFDTVKTALLGVDKILKEFPKAKSIFKGVGMTKAGIMSTSFDGDINFNSYYFEKGNPSAINAMLIGSANGKFPKNSSILTAGSHEAGHLLERALIEHGDYSMYSGGYAETLMKGDDWDKFTYSKKVISEACKAAKKTPSGKGITNPRLKRQVSEYATQNDSECLAECVQDYVANGDKATVLSKEVWKILKERLG
jgi:SPP1 gp7 family putative phage head morphogenesis protein